MCIVYKELTDNGAAALDNYNKLISVTKLLEKLVLYCKNIYWYIIKNVWKEIKTNG